ncbi:MAG: VCBS repeat-containing protein [Acidobacteria bacterium]|nr:VCBS repeat-containing protein [Acidobacteriota bacterium]
MKKNKKIPAFLLMLLVLGMLLSLSQTQASHEISKENLSKDDINPLAFVPCGIQGFSPPTSISATTPVHNTVGDVNLDGILDIVTANFSANTISIFYGDGLGGFNAPMDIPVGTAPVYVEIARLDSDAQPEIIAVNGDSNDVSIVFFGGEGGFFVDSVSVGTDPFSAAAGDFNGDGTNEIAVTNLGNNTVSIISGGDGFFVVNTIDVGLQPFSVATADLNKDSFLDLAVTNQGAGTVSILIGDGDNGFTSTTTLTVGANPQSVKIADLNIDGNLDLAVANLGSNNISVLLGNGAGGFTNQTGSPYAVANNPQVVVISDLNGDGRLDLASSSSSTQNISVLLANPTTGFAPSINFLSGVTNTAGGLASLVTADFNSDGKPDIAATGLVSNNISLLFNTFSARCIAPSFGTPTNFPTGTDSLDNTVADLNLDGRLDVIIQNRGSGDLSILLGSPGGFTPAPTVSTGGNNPLSSAVGDFNRDGNPDIAVANNFSNDLSILIGNGTGTFSLLGPFPVGGANPSSVAIEDFSGDGIKDVITANTNSNSLSLFFGDGVSVSTPPSIIDTGSNPLLVAGDFDRDGRPDLVLTLAGDNTIQTLLNNGEGFSPSATIPSGGTQPFIQDLGDFNRDGILDILITNFASMTGNVFLGDGVGGFSPSVVVSSAQRLRFADFNGDGKLDIFAGTEVGTNLRILLGNGAGGVFSTINLPFIFGNSFTIAPADFNRDGRLDLGSVTFGSGNAFALRSSACIGAPNSILATLGSGQSAVLNSPFANPLQATVFDPNGNALNGIMVQFDTPTPATSAGATFPGLATTAFATTNSAGIAVSPTLTANNFTGSYMATASVINDSGVVICTSPGYSLTNICPTITLSPVGLPTGTINVPYNQTITASGGISPYSFDVSLGTLPPGLTLDSTGVLSGTPTMLGTFNFTITAADSNGCAGMQAYTLTISCANITFTPSTLVAGLVGSPYNQAITINGATIPISVSLMSGTLPPGLSLIPPATRTDNIIRIQGTPTANGTFNFTLQVVDGNGCIGTQTYALVINCAAITLSPTGLANGQVGVQYSQALSATGGKAPYTFSLASGNLPSGLSVFATGGIVGTPNTSGTFNFTVQTRDANNCVGTRNYTLVIGGSAGSINFSVGSLSVTEGNAATITVTRTGGSNGSVSVNYGTNNGSAVSGRDFNSASGSLNFTNGDASSKSFTIQTIANNAFEANKTLTVSLFSVTGGANLGLATLTLTILEKDVARPGRLAFSQPSFTVNETAGVATIVVGRSDGGNVAISVNFSTSPGANAQAGTNYFDVSGTLNFPANVLSQSFNVPIINDRQPGQNKLVNLLLTGATNGALIAANTATLTIVESTPPPNPPVLQADNRIDFGAVNIGDMAKRTVTLRNMGGQDLTFTSPVINGAGITLSTPSSTNTLAPNQSTTFELTLKPTPGSLGSVNGSVIVNSNGGNLTIPITGQSVDTKPPSVTFTNLAGGDLLTAGSLIRIRYDATDNDAINDFTASFIATQNAISPKTGAMSGDIARADSTTREIVWFIPADLETSNARVVITARDRADNLMTVSSGQFSIRRANNSAPILQTVVSFTAPVPTPGQILPPTNVIANATEIRDAALTQPSQPALLVQITFDPPPPNQLLPPQNVKVKAGELVGNLAQVNKINPKADGDLVIAGYNVYRVPQPTDGTMPPVDQIVNPNNLVTSLPANATSFMDKVSTSGSSNYTYSVSTFFGNGQMSSGSQPMGTNLPVIINPVFTQGTIFLDSPSSFIKMGATLVVNDIESYPLQFDSTGTRFTIAKKQASSSGTTIKKLIGKTSIVKLVVKNPDGNTSVAVMFGRKGIVRAIANNTKGDLDIEPKADPMAIAGYNIYRVPQPADGRILSPSDIVKPENLVGSIPANMTSFTDKVSTSSSSSGNFVYSVSTFFGNGQMSSGSQPASTDLPVIKNPVFIDKNFFVDSPGSFIKMDATLIINDTEMYALEFDDTGTRFTPRRKTGSPSGQTVDKFIKKGDRVRLTIKNPDGKLSVGVMFTRN